jgi:hypothetical protein
MHIESFEAACAKLGLDAAACLPDVSRCPPKHQKAFIANAKLTVISEASWEGKQPDWNDDEEDKWYPWFDLEVTDKNPSGFRFLRLRTTLARIRYTSCGSRLCFRTRNACEDAANKPHFSISGYDHHSQIAKAGCALLEPRCSQFQLPVQRCELR